MSTITLEHIAHELKEIREFMAGIGNTHLDRQQFAARLGVSVDTLARRIKAGTVPQPQNGRWPLTVIQEWERSEKRGKV